jgi:hypothetical protein
MTTTISSMVLAGWVSLLMPAKKETWLIIFWRREEQGESVFCSVPNTLIIVLTSADPRGSQQMLGLSRRSQSGQRLLVRQHQAPGAATYLNPPFDPSRPHIDDRYIIGRSVGCVDMPPVLTRPDTPRARPDVADHVHHLVAYDVDDSHGFTPAIGRLLILSQRVKIHLAVLRTRTRPWHSSLDHYWTAKILSASSDFERM